MSLKRIFPIEYAVDYVVATLPIEKYPKLQFDYNQETGEVESTPSLVPLRNPRMVDVPLLFAPDGDPVFPACLYLHHLIIEGRSSVAKKHADALLMFYRWLNGKNKTIFNITDIPEDGVVWQFRDYLRDNQRQLSADGHEIIKDGIAASTAKVYILTIVNYYEWMHVYYWLRISPRRVPFNYRIRRTLRKKRKGHNENILSHLRTGENDAIITVLTTELTQCFGKTQTVQKFKKLHPMNIKDKAIFDEFINKSDNALNLMLQLALATGLRLQELVTFPAGLISSPKQDITTVPISPDNGCMTKNGKQRNIQIPAALMHKLLQYKLSDKRTKKAEQDIQGASTNTYERLFLTQMGLPYAANTVEKHWSDLRKKIQKKYPEWYHRLHDTRATFATHYLYHQHLITGLPYEILMTDLSELMGHEETAETQKYVAYLNNHDMWLAFAARKNKFVSE